MIHRLSFVLPVIAAETPEHEDLEDLEDLEERIDGNVSSRCWRKLPWSHGILLFPARWRPLVTA